MRSRVPPIVDEVLLSPSQPLDAETRAFMEPRFGYDFGNVRVHTDAKAGESARAIDALAYTVGRDVVFAANQYAPRTSSGQRLLAHELTHVMQQSNQASVDEIAHPADPAEQKAEFRSVAAPASMPPTVVHSSGMQLYRQTPPTSPAVAPPAITKLEPDRGSVGGNDTVSITGSGLAGATSVSFGTRDALRFTVIDDTEIEATSPPSELPWDVHVDVTTSGGTSAPTDNNKFSYLLAPVVSEVSPDRGWAGGGEDVAIKGSGFDDAFEVDFVSDSAFTFVDEAKFTTDSDAQITAKTPGGAGTAEVVVIGVGGTSPIEPANLLDKFTYVSARVTGLSPSVGSEAGQETVIITGDGLSNAFKVEFGDDEALKFAVDSDTQITAMTPPGTGIVDVVVWGVDGASGVNRVSKFTYKALAGGDYPPPALEPGTAYA